MIHEEKMKRGTVTHYKRFNRPGVYNSDMKSYGSLHGQAGQVLTHSSDMVVSVLSRTTDRCEKQSRLFTGSVS